MGRTFFDPVIIPAVWQREGYDSYLEWERDQHIDEMSYETKDMLLLVSITLNIVFIYIGLLVI